MNKESAAVKALNSMHISWIYLDSEIRRNYHLDKAIAFYHSDFNGDIINQIEKHFNNLCLKKLKDYYIQETSFDDRMIYTICLKTNTGKKLEKLGVELTERLH